MRPRIGITAATVQLAAGGIHRKLLPYVRAVERGGGAALLLANVPADVEATIDDIDGIVFSGGADVDPARYRGNPEHSRAETGDYDAARDSFELALALAARMRGVPTLAICRGLQVTNVAFGGTLVEDLPDELGERYLVAHRQTSESGLARGDYGHGHVVALEPDSRLATLFGAERVPTNSLHHQAVRGVGEGLRVVGRTPDGVVEACELEAEHPFFVAVQWHPEELADDANARLFSALTDAAAAHRDRR